MQPEEPSCSNLERKRRHEKECDHVADAAMKMITLGMTVPVKSEIEEGLIIRKKKDKGRRELQGSHGQEVLLRCGFAFVQRVFASCHLDVQGRIFSTNQLLDVARNKPPELPFLLYNSREPNRLPQATVVQATVCFM